jgi:hypothetical protein
LGNGAQTRQFLGGFLAPFAAPTRDFG